MNGEVNEEELAKLMQQLQMLEQIAKKHMTKEAISRYGNVKIAHQELAIKAIAFIAQAVQLGHIDIVDDEKFKEILRSLQEKKEFRIKK